MQAAYNIKEVEPGLVRVQIIGEPSVVDSEKMAAEAIAYLKQYEGQVDFLVDIQHAVRPAPAAGNLSFLRTLNTFSAFRAAIYGASPVMERTIRTVLQIAGAANRIGLFQDEAAARQWLQNRK